jgi:hypothetical protein
MYAVVPAYCVSGFECVEILSQAELMIDRHKTAF